ncbi:glyceraldehyde 3-phosphate dehydrogenase NAD-binding domain-containing protein, partial [Klebsiella pneumoniae]
MVKVGINGFGRIGRNVLRAALNNPDIQIVAINDLTDSKTLAHLLKYDSLLGKLDAEVTAGEGGLVVDGKPITVFSERNPASIPWRQCEVDIVIEATGLFTDREKAAVHIHSGGAKRVIISAPGKNDDLTIVMGVNESLYSPDKHYVISNGSCTTNGLAPAAQVLHQHFGIILPYSAAFTCMKGMTVIVLMWEEAAIKDDVIEYDIAFNIIYIMRTHVVVANLRCPS